MIITKRFKNTPDPLPNLEKNEVFVFGANEMGRHGAGSALAAMKFFGAVYGEVHRTGRSYGIITKHFEFPPATKENIIEEFKLFFFQTILEQEKTFYLTKVGTSLAGFSIEDIANFLIEAGYNHEEYPNIVLPIEFEEIYLRQLNNKQN